MMVENNEEGEEVALVNSDGSKDASEEENKCERRGSRCLSSSSWTKEGEGGRDPTSCCGPLLGCCCRGQRKKENKGNYVACHLCFEYGLEN